MTYSRKPSEKVRSEVYEAGTGTFVDSRYGTTFDQKRYVMLLGTNQKDRCVNPNWKRDIAKAVDTSSPYYFRKYIPMVGPAKWRTKAMTTDWVQKYYFYRCRSDARSWSWGQPYIDPIALSDVPTRERALSKIKKKLASRVSGANVMAPVAELRELKDLVHQMTFLSVNFCHAALTARKTHGRSAWKFLTDTWLGYNFALKPLLSDIGNVGDAIASYIERSDLSFRETASATMFGSYSYVPLVYGVGMPAGVPGYTAQGEAHYKLSYRWTGGFDIALRSGEDYSMLDHLGIGFDQIPATLWELTAFSWMFDYFTNIGSFLEDVFTTPPGQTKYLTLARRSIIECTHTFKYKNHTSSDWVTLENVGDFARIKVVDFERTVHSALPHAGLYFKHLDQIGQSGLTKLANLVSVLKLTSASDAFTPRARKTHTHSISTR